MCTYRWKLILIKNTSLWTLEQEQLSMNSRLYIDRGVWAKEN